LTNSLFVRARLALAVAARESADLSRGIVGDVSTPMRPGERVKKARRVRLMSLAIVDRAVLAELTDGATWEQVGDALGIDCDEARRRYEPTWRQWVEGDYDDDADFGDFGVGLRGDLDLPGTADALDSWWLRHAEPWETALDAPVMQVLVDGEAAPSDG
jgi:hypothetical protein